MHLVQSLLQAVLFAGIHTDCLQGFQLGGYAPVQQVLHREGVPDTLLALLDGMLVILKEQQQVKGEASKPVMQEHYVFAASYNSGKNQIPWSNLLATVLLACHYTAV